jgi:hypothetical protein
MAKINSLVNNKYLIFMCDIHLIIEIVCPYLSYPDLLSLKLTCQVQNSRRWITLYDGSPIARLKQFGYMHCVRAWIYPYDKCPFFIRNNGIFISDIKFKNKKTLMMLGGVMITV